ncbi:hypothetical protein EBR78_05730 [bacterium]|nr:hypothetical protein [bacterium]
MHIFRSLIVLITLIALVSACSSRRNGETSSFSGVVQLGRVDGATVKVFALDSQGNRVSPPLAETQTNSEGEYSLSFNSFSGPVEVVSSGGNFIDEATGQLVNLANTDELSAVSASGISSGSISITPLTALTIARFKRLLSAQGQPNPSAALLQTFEEVAELWGTDLEGIFTIPAKPSSPKLGTLRAGQSAFIIAAFSQFLKDQGASPIEAISYLKALQEDFEDGRVDGEREGQALGNLHRRIANNWSTGMFTAATRLAMGSNSSTFSGFDPAGLKFNAAPSPIIFGVESANATYQAVSNAADGFLDLVPVGDAGNSPNNVLRGYPARVADGANWVSNEIVRFVAGVFYRGLSIIEDLTNLRTTTEKNGFSDGLRGDDRFGKVDYHFMIGKYEVTNSQYVAFLNAVAQTDPYYLFLPGISDSGQGGIIRTGTSGSYTYSVRSGFENKPVTSLTWFSCARFANWLHNGKPTGPASLSTTEDGAYTLNGAMSDFNISKNANATAEISFNYANPQPTASQPWGVNNTQYVEFLNAVAQTDTYALYSPSFNRISRSGTEGSYLYTVTSNGTDKVNGAGMSFWRAARYANWVHNGKPTGPQTASTTEDGAYTLNGANGPTPILRNPGAKFSISSEDEWYKAAYYKGGGLDAGYWDYPFQSDLAPMDNSKNNESGTLMEVGSFSAFSSAYGTLDQAGNAWEWNEGVVLKDYAGNDGFSRSAMGTGNYRRASWRGWWTPHYVNGGMRVSARSVPTIASSGSATEIVIRGRGFQSGVQVLIGSSECQVTQSTKHTINCLAPQLPPGTYNITVTNLSGKMVTLTDAIRLQ